jgi:type VI protein secretion system component Hcp
MADETRDTLMKIVMNGQPIPSECAAVVLPGDPLASGFTSASQGNGWKGDYFRVNDFDVKVGLMPDSQPDAQDQMEAFRALAEAQKGEGKDPGRKSSDFGRFMSRGKSVLRGQTYASDLEPVKISKVLDKSSLTLFTACANGTFLDQAILIKRRGGGGAALRTYLRMVFTGLLVIDFDWSEGPVIKETFSFVCRKAEISYSVENDDGTLKAPLPVRTWSVKNSKQTPG